MTPAGAFQPMGCSMKQIDRLLIKAEKISIEYGESVIVISFADGEWLSGGRCFQSIEEAEQAFCENAKGDLLFIVNDIGAPGYHPLGALISKQKARYRRREKRRLLAAKKVKEAERLKRIIKAAEHQEAVRQEQETEIDEKRKQLAVETAGKVI